MDPVAHTLTGAALAAAGLRRVTPLATTALLVGANIADIDVLVYLGGTAAALEHRRGWTHGVLSIVVWPFLIAVALLAFDRFVRLRRSPDAPPARAGPLVIVSAIAVVSHPLLDWLNNYGLRWLMPFDGTWFYGDALFIIDPWMWLLFGGVSFLAFSQRRSAIALWLLFLAVASYIVLSQPGVPMIAKLIFGAGVVGFVTLRASGFSWQHRQIAVQRIARASVALMGVYISVAVLANLPARAEVRAAFAADGVGPVQAVMVGPVPGNALAGSVIVQTEDAYHFGVWRWWTSPRFQPARGDVVLRGMEGEVFEAARQQPEAKRFLVWSRFPYVQVLEDDDGYVVRFRDARFREVDRGLVGGVTVTLDNGLRPR